MGGRPGALERRRHPPRLAAHHRDQRSAQHHVAAGAAGAFNIGPARSGIAARVSTIITQPGRRRTGWSRWFVRARLACRASLATGTPHQEAAMEKPAPRVRALNATLMPDCSIELEVSIPGWD